MSEMSTPPENQWNDYWNNDGAKGEVFVGSDGSANPELGDWWRARFETLSTGCDIVDLACGAGSVFAHLPDRPVHQLHGADISPDALALMKARLPQVTTTVCSADDLPFGDGHFDVVCSQFGIEYAGADAFNEAARVTRTGGQLWVLCHIENGYIDARNRAHLAQANVITDTRFIEHALALIRASFSGSAESLGRAVEAFKPAEQALARACGTLPEGIHTHLYAGFRQLYEQRQQYDLSDIEQWLTAMRDDVQRNIERLAHMCRAASDDAFMQDVTRRLADEGCVDIAYAPLRLARHRAPVAWALTARR